jgi:hypothetical protein
VRLLQRRNREREPPLATVLLAHRHRAVAQGFEHEADDVLVQVFRLPRIDVEEAHFRSERAAAEGELEPPAAHLVEHADLLEQAQPVVQR